MKRTNIQCLLTLNVREAAEDIENYLEEELEPYKGSYFLPNTEKSIFEDGVEYYSYVDNQRVRIDLKNEKLILHSIVVDKNDHLVFDPKGGLIAITEFKSTPDKSYRGFKIALDVIDSTLFGLLEGRHFVRISLEDVLRKYLKEEAFLNTDRLDAIKDRVSVMMMELKSALVDFIDNEYYREYDITHKSMLIFVTKSEDFRIREYYRLKGLENQYKEAIAHGAR